MKEKEPAFTIVDRRGANKDPVVRHEAELAVTEPTGDIKEWKSRGYVSMMVAIPQMGNMWVCRGIGLRGDSLMPVVDWIMPQQMWEGMNPVKIVMQRMDTFLGCDCRIGKMCSQHGRYVQQWMQADMERIQRQQAEPMCEALEVYMRAEMARQQQRVAVPGR